MLWWSAYLSSLVLSACDASLDVAYVVPNSETFDHAVRGIPDIPDRVKAGLEKLVTADAAAKADISGLLLHSDDQGPVVTLYSREGSQRHVRGSLPQMDLAEVAIAAYEATPWRPGAFKLICILTDDFRLDKQFPASWDAMVAVLGVLTPRSWGFLRQRLDDCPDLSNAIVRSSGLREQVVSPQVRRSRQMACVDRHLTTALANSGADTVSGVVWGFTAVHSAVKHMVVEAVETSMCRDSPPHLQDAAEAPLHPPVSGKIDWDDDFDRSLCINFLVGDLIIYARDYTTDRTSIMGDEATSIYFQTQAGFMYQKFYQSPFDSDPMACARECHTYKYPISNYVYKETDCLKSEDTVRLCRVRCFCALNHDAEEHYESVWSEVGERNFWKTFYPTQFQQYFFSARPVASSLQSTDVQCRKWCMNVVTPQCKYWTFHLVDGVCSALVDTGKIIFNEDYMSGYGTLPDGMPPWPADYVPHSVRGGDPIQDWTTVPKMKSEDISTTIAYPGLLVGVAAIFYTVCTLLIILSIVAPIIIILILWLTKNRKGKNTYVNVRGRVIRHELTPGGHLETVVLEDSEIYDSSEAVLM